MSQQSKIGNVLLNIKNEAQLPEEPQTISVPSHAHASLLKLSLLPDMKNKVAKNGINHIGTTTIGSQKVRYDSNYEPIKCKVCPSTKGIGFYYGISQVCNSCRMFFRRCFQSNKQPICINEDKDCQPDNSDADKWKLCKGCRYKKCLDIGLKTCLINPDKNGGSSGSSTVNSRSSNAQKRAAASLPTALPSIHVSAPNASAVFLSRQQSVDDSMPTLLAASGAPMELGPRKTKALQLLPRPAQ